MEAGSEIAVARSARGSGSSPLLIRTLRRRSLIAPLSFHLIPESSTAIVTSGRPVVVIHAVFAAPLASSMCAPRTPPSSTGFELSRVLLGSGVAANLNSLPSPERSFGVSPAFR